MPAVREGEDASRRAPGPFKLDADFRIVAREAGSERLDLPIFTAVRGAVRLADEPSPGEGLGGGAREAQTCWREDLADVYPGAFLLHNVASDEECAQIMALSEAMGYTEDAPVSLGRHIRQNDNCVWIADPALSDAFFRRCLPHLPAEVDGGMPVGLNMRWRLYRYNPNDVFKVHTDGSWPGSGLDASSGRLVQDLFCDRWSQLTWVLYLNDDFDGGATRFFSRDGRRVTGEVPARRGSALCFFHGTHPLSPLHEGGLVSSGTKYIIRSDVLYRLPHSSQEGVQAPWQKQYR